MLATPCLELNWSVFMQVLAGNTEEEEQWYQSKVDIILVLDEADQMLHMDPFQS